MTLSDRENTLYDTSLLDELRQNTNGSTEETISLAQKAVDSVVAGSEDGEESSPPQLQAGANEEGTTPAVDSGEQLNEAVDQESLLDNSESESWSDDPVRMYLTRWVRYRS